MTSKTFNITPKLSLPKIIIGLWQIADMERNNNNLDLNKKAESLNLYVNNGFSIFDMADHYGSSEIIAGICKNNHPNRDSIKLLTKWVPKPGPIDKKTVYKAVKNALERMNQKSIDLLQFHTWTYTNPYWIDALIYLKDLKEEGLIKNIGVTNFDAKHLRIACATGIPIVSNQISHSIVDQRAKGKMKAVCDQYSVRLLAYGTVLGGFLSKRWLGSHDPKEEELKTWSQMKYYRFIKASGGWKPFQNLLTTLNEISLKHKTSIANIASKFVLNNKNVSSVIIGARIGESSHIEDHKNLLDIFLDKDDTNKIEEVIEILKPIPGDCGDEYRTPPFLTASGDLSHHLENIPSVFKEIKASKNRFHVFSGTEWESLAGYSRAVKKGKSIFVSGTTATHRNMIIGGNDVIAQTHFAIDKLESAITSLGGKLENVIRTRVFVNNINDWEAVAKVHGERFKNINPANTLVESKLVGDGYKVEIEAEAVLD
ncbi:MAG: aldo/keto reductase [Flavobacteriaceae bacterium]|nr:aldo/keto reductase [Flavobacteriaceae bacterium]